MNDDRYLWDRSGTPDPEVVRLEKLLEPLRHRGSMPEIQESGPPPPDHPRRRSALLLIAASIAIVIAAGAMLALRSPLWEVQLLDVGEAMETPRLISQSRVERGDVIETRQDEQALLRMGPIGEVEVDPMSRLRVVRTALRQSRLALDRGIIHARISAPPRLFFVSTPVGEAIDLGCAYTLETDEDGNGLLSVTLGWVALETRQGSAYVPAGYDCRMDADGRLGTPVSRRTDSALRAAVQSWDRNRASAGERHRLLSVILRNASEQDGITLWHLLRETGSFERRLIVARSDELDLLPVGIDSRALEQGQRDAIAEWGRSLGIHPARWWVSWMRTAWRNLAEALS